MSALQHIKDYLTARFAGHDIETLMQHFETAIEAKVEDAVAGVRHEIEALREELMGGRPISDPPEPAKSDDMPSSADETGSAS